MSKDNITDLFPPSALEGVLPESCLDSGTSHDQANDNEDIGWEAPVQMPSDRHVYRVSELISKIRTCLDIEFATLWIEGEISSFSKAASGHCYFTIREDNSCLKCVMFRASASSLSFEPEEGMIITCRGNLNVYAGRGDLQLVVDRMEPAGRGILFARFQEMQQRLEAEGLFDPDRKKQIPPFPRRIFLVTSASGAAVRDFIRTARNRWRGVEIVLVPALVQGVEAPADIVRALGVADAAASYNDVIVVSRGGGSIEDLWAFNEEAVVRAIYRCSAPVVSGVGHETDFALADYVADFRAATPTAAAVAVTPDALELGRVVRTLLRRAEHSLKLLLSRSAITLQELRHRLRDPGKLLVEQRQRLDDAVYRMEHAVSAMLSEHEAYVTRLFHRLRIASPERAVERRKSLLHEMQMRLVSGMKQIVSDHKADLGEISARLQAISPLAVLSRGYSLVVIPENQQILRDAREVQPGDTVVIKPYSGKVECEVKAVIDDES